MKFLIAILDGKTDTQGDNLTPQCFTNVKDKIPVLKDFDPHNVIGFADLIIEDEKLYAKLDDFNVEGYPALGGVVDPTILVGPRFKITCIGVCKTRNIDIRIPIINEKSKN